MVSDKREVLTDTESGKRRHFLSDVVVYGIAGILAQSLSFFLVPLYTHFLDTADYGVLDLINQFGRVVSMVLMLNGISMATMTFFLQAESEREKKEVVSSLIIFVVCSICGGILLMLPLSFVLTHGFKLAYPNWLIVLGGVTVLAEMVSAIPYVLMQARIESKRFLFWTIGTLLVRLIATIVVVAILGWGIVGILAVRTVTSSIVGTVLLSMELRQSWVTPDWNTMLRILRYSFPFIPVAIFSFVGNGSQRFFLLATNGPAELGLYALGATLCSAVSLLAVRPFEKVWTAKMYAVYETVNAKTRTGQVGTTFVAIHTLAAFPLLLFGNEIIGVISAKDYAGANVVLLPLIIAAVVETFTRIPDQVFHVYHKTQYKPFLAGAIALIATGVYALLVPIYGIKGAAWGLVIVSMCRVVIVVLMSRRFFAITFEFGKLALIVALTTSAVLCAMLCPDNAYGITVKVLLLPSWVLVACLADIIPRNEVLGILRVAKSLVTRVWKDVRRT